MINQSTEKITDLVFLFIYDGKYNEAATNLTNYSDFIIIFSENQVKENMQHDSSYVSRS